MERENLFSDVKGQATSGSNREGESTEAERRGGAARSSDEGSVMGLERRGQVIAADLGQPGDREELFVQWRPPGLARWHEPDDARASSPDL